MPVYRGPKAILIQPEGERFAVAYPEYDHQTREYEITLTKAQAAKHGNALLAEGMREIDQPAPKNAAPEASEGDD